MLHESHDSPRHLPILVPQETVVFPHRFLTQQYHFRCLQQCVSNRHFLGLPSRGLFPHDYFLPEQHSPPHYTNTIQVCLLTAAFLSRVLARVRFDQILVRFCFPLKKHTIAPKSLHSVLPLFRHFLPFFWLFQAFFQQFQGLLAVILYLSSLYLEWDL